MRPFYTHEDETLNALIGKEVSVKFYDGTVYFGKLGRGDGWNYHNDRYRIDDKNKGTIVFRKTHITHINGKRRKNK